MFLALIRQRGNRLARGYFETICCRKMTLRLRQNIELCRLPPPGPPPRVSSQVCREHIQPANQPGPGQGMKVVQPRYPHPHPHVALSLWSLVTIFLHEAACYIGPVLCRKICFWKGQS